MRTFGTTAEQRSVPSPELDLPFWHPQGWRTLEDHHKLLVAVVEVVRPDAEPRRSIEKNV